MIFDCTITCIVPDDKYHLQYFSSLSNCSVIFTLIEVFLFITVSNATNDFLR